MGVGLGITVECAATEFAMIRFAAVDVAGFGLVQSVEGFHGKFSFRVSPFGVRLVLTSLDCSVSFAGGFRGCGDF